MNIKERLVEMKKQLMLMFDDAIADCDAAFARQNTEEWKEYADEWELPESFLEDSLNDTVRLVDKLVDDLNGELYAFEEIARVPFEEFI